MKRKIFNLLMVVVLALTLVSTPATTLSAQAANKNYMKSLDLKWDLKKNKTLKSKTYFLGVGLVPITIKMSNCKVKKIKNGKYKQMTMTLTYKLSYTPSAKDVEKVLNANEGIGWYTCYGRVDFKNGKARMDIPVKTTYKYSNYTTRYSGSDWIRYHEVAKVKLTFTYPSDEHNFCILVSGYPTIPGKDNELFNSRKITFEKTKLYKKLKKNIHCMRVKS